MKPAEERLAIFPLNVVLFPGGRLPLRIFEQRYMGMARDCLRREQPFGVCLIAAGSEVGEPALPHDVGVSARITGWDMENLGVLQVVARGERRFRIENRDTGADGLVTAKVEWLPQPLASPVPRAQQKLIPLLRAIAEDMGTERLPPPHDFDDAAWLGHRFAELLPIPLLARQKLLELDDDIARLEIIQRYLAQHGVLR
ncbi:MAG: LON peptidase substrate-binding domain-containing protein [Betaproteobacteria bacterium]|nr:LON peptidase substrate-binding domain-containing protein [Betaproteobacteria bacterium]